MSLRLQAPRLALASLLASVGLLAFFAAPALASRPYLFQITEGSQPLRNPWPLAVDGSNDLWVIDSSGDTLDKFSPTGTLLAETNPSETGYSHGIAFSNASNHLIVGQSSGEHLEIYNADATFNSSLSEFTANAFSNFLYLAADNSVGPGGGSLYVTGGHNLFPVANTAVVRINSAGKPVNFSASAPAYIENSQLFGTPSAPFTDVHGVAVGPTGLLYVSDEGQIDEYKPSGEFVRTFSHANGGDPVGSPTALAVDPTSGNVLVIDASVNFIDEFNPSGEFIEEYTAADGAPFGRPQGIAVDSTGRLYVSDGEKGVVDVFGPAGAPATKFRIQVEKSGLGGGLVTSEPRGISCGTRCGHEFSEGLTLILTATPKPGSEFSGWTGCDAEPSPNECQVDVTAARSVQAQFAQTPSAREFDTQITGQTPPDAPVAGPFQNPSAIAIDATDDAWIGDEGMAAITEYDPLGGYLSQQTGAGHWQRGEPIPRGIAIDHANGSLYVVNLSTEQIDIFDQAGAFTEARPFELGGEHQIGIDNTGGASQGRYYTVDNVLRAFSSDGQEHEFSANGDPGKGYILGAKITGTPTETFGFMSKAAPVGPAGEIYVFDDTHRQLDEYDSSGTFVQEITGTDVPGGFSQEVTGVAVDPKNGDVLVGGRIEEPAGFGEPSETVSVIDEFSSTGEYLGQLLGTAPTARFGSSGSIAVNSEGYVYVIDQGKQIVDVFLPRGDVLPSVSAKNASNVARTSATLSGEVGPGLAGEEVTQCHFDYVDASDYKPWEDDPFGSGASAGTAPCLNGAGETAGTAGKPINALTPLHADVSNLVAQSTYHWRISATGTNANGTAENTAGTDFVTPPAVLDVQTGPALEIGNVTATLSGTFTGEQSVDAHFYFEYGTTTKYGHHSSVPPGVDHPGAGSQQVSAEITELVPNTTYHYRVVVVNGFGETHGNDRTFTTATKPTIDAFSSSGVTAGSADLHAQIDPNGFATTYRFEYGVSAEYGQTAPIPDGEISDGLSEVHGVVVHLTGLQPVTYHFRVTAENKWGSVTTEDQTFEFFPSDCPNSVVRQQTGASYLPDCRAYELVSPADGNGTLFFPGGPATGQATEPARFSFTGLYSAPVGSNVIDTAGDLYVSSRTNTGWHTKYVGLPGDQAGCLGGPPNLESSRVVGWTSPQSLTNTIATNPSMSDFLLWRDGTPINCATGTGVVFFDGTWLYASPSNAPYMVGADGNLDRRLPAGLSPEALKAFECPYESIEDGRGQCSGDVKPSGDLTHMAFSSSAFEFAAGGSTAAPGSAYDYDVATGHTTLISTLPGGAPIPVDPTYTAGDPKSFQGEFIRFPAVSSDGSHILMSAATRPTPECEKYENPTTCPRFTDTPVHLYMSVDDAAAMEIAGGKAVKYVGMTPDGSEVYFTSSEQLSSEDRDQSVDLYAWSAATNSLTLLSKGDDEGKPGEPGNSDECEAAVSGGSPWTQKCDVVPYSGYAFSVVPGYGGNGISDTALATENGDIYFYSPELLDGDRGVAGEQNLYDYREGRPRFVASFDPDKYCVRTGFFQSTPQATIICSEGPIARLNVAPDDSHAAFTSTERLTPYDNAGRLEMYLYTQATGAIVCVSCRPDGEAPNSDVQASSDGLFMTDDGRTFFSTTESLVPRDTNNALDTYEYVDGRPQLISPGTGTAPPPHEGGKGNPTAVAEIPGLIGVSADGTDAYFATFDGLVPEDHNGGFYRFYDARTGGGFAQPTPEQPCSAAEECHGAGTEPPQLLSQATIATLSGGNANSDHTRKHNKKKRHKKRHGTKKSGKHRRASQRGDR